MSGLECTSHESWARDILSWTKSALHDNFFEAIDVRSLMDSESIA